MKDTRIKYKLSDFFKENLYIENKKLYFGNKITLLEISSILNFPKKQIATILKLQNYNDATILTTNQISELCLEKNIDFENIVAINENNVLNNISNLINLKKWNDDAIVSKKTPIVTIMGHVDHGKTTLLDKIRKTSIVDKEIGGITQKIGAYQVEFEKQKITFIDTPGHEAFVKMRSKGSKITDVAIIVVAADDSIMPQTKESIDHAKNAKVPIIVAITKMDKPSVDIEKVKHELSDYGVMPEEWGGEIPFIPVSSFSGEGINELLKTIILVSEVNEKKVYKNMIASGVVLESNLDKKLGNTVTLLVENGILKIGDTILIDDVITKIKAMIDYNGKRIEEATEGMPIEIFGVGKSPETGVKFSVIVDEKEATKIVSIVQQTRKNENKTSKLDFSIEELFSNSQPETQKKVLNIFLKANGFGILEAIYSKIAFLENDDIKINIIKKDIGEINNSDIMFAETTNSSFYTFQLKTSDAIKKILDSKKIILKEFDIIYKLFEDLEEKLEGMKVKKYAEEKIGEVEVKAIFESSKFGKIAGCQVKSGIVKNNSIISVLRKGKEISKTKIDALKHQKDNVKEVKEGHECGITLHKFADFEVGDILVSYNIIEVK